MEHLLQKISGQTYSVKTLTRKTYIFTFNDGTVTGWEGVLGYCTAHRNKLVVKWVDEKYGKDSINFNETLKSFTIFSQTHGIARGSLTTQLIDQSVAIKNQEPTKSLQGVAVKQNKIATFVMALKNRPHAALKSIRSLVTAESVKVFDFIVVEDKSDNLLDLSAFPLSKHIRHYVVNTNRPWNKSALINYGFRLADSICCCTWDSDFLYPKYFTVQFLNELKTIDLNKYFLRTPCVETDDSIRCGRMFKKGCTYGGFFTFLTRRIKELRGYDETYDLWGWEDIDFNVRYKNLFHCHERTTRTKIYHCSHSDNLRGSLENIEKNKHKCELAQRFKKTVVNDECWGTLSPSKIGADSTSRFEIYTDRPKELNNLFLNKTIAIIGPDFGTQTEGLDSYDIVVSFNCMNNRYKRIVHYMDNLELNPASAYHHRLLNVDPFPDEDEHSVLGSSVIKTYDSTVPILSMFEDLVGFDFRVAHVFGFSKHALEHDAFEGIKSIIQSDERIYMDRSMCKIFGSDKLAETPQLVLPFKASFIIPFNKRRKIDIDNIVKNIDSKYGLTDYEIVFAEQTTEEYFRKGQLTNLVISRCRSDNIVLMDADIRFCQPIDIVGICNQYPNSIVLPWTYKQEINELGPNQFKILDGERTKLMSGYGGMNVFTKKAFFNCFGFSNLFYGWGAEDTELNSRCRGMKRLNGDLYHVKHERDEFKPQFKQVIARNRSFYYQRKNRNEQDDTVFHTTCSKMEKVEHSYGQSVQHWYISGIGVSDCCKLKSLIDKMNKEKVEY